MQRVCGYDCLDAPFPHIEVTTNGKINPKNGDEIPGKKFILCLDCRHYCDRPRGNCRCQEMCHIGDLDETGP